MTLSVFRLFPAPLLQACCVLLLLVPKVPAAESSRMPNFGAEQDVAAHLGAEDSAEKSIELSPLQLSKKGPWGQLEYFEALLDAPTELVKESQPKSIRTRWFFGKMDQDAVSEFLGSLELPEELAKELNDRDRWIVETSGVTIFPKTGQILALPEKARIQLYRKLAKWSENAFHAEPEIVYGNSVRKWFEGFEISEEALHFIETASYATLSSRLFADTPAVLSIAKSENERIQILRAFSRTPTLVAKLRLQSGSAEELSSYWNKGIRFKETSTFLGSMKRYDAVHKIDLVHLLPAGVRKILYTFPSPSHTRSGYLPDCHWSSLNFFNPEPLERLSDPPQATAYTLENFTQVSPPYELGDVLFFTDTQTGDAYHSCTYIADDIVFTKNGRSPLQPWILMKLEQVKDLYDLHFRTNTTAYRRKI